MTEWMMSTVRKSSRQILSLQRLRQTAQVGWYAGTTTAHSQLSCLLRLVAWSAGDGHQQVDRLHVTVVHALADSGCQVLELQDRGVSR